MTLVLYIKRPREDNQMKKLENCTLNEALVYIKENTPKDIVSEENSLNENDEDACLKYIAIDKDNIKHTYKLTPTSKDKFNLFYELDSVYNGSIVDDLDFI